MPISDYIKNIRAKIGNDLLLLPGVTAVVINSRDELLLQLRRDTKTWAPPSGGLEPGENLAQCVIREVLEETGIEVIPESIIAVLSGDDFTVTYPNGDQIGVVSTVFRCRPCAESVPRVNDNESLDMRYFHPNALPENMLPRHRWIIAKALENDSDTYFNPASW
ncbi:MAG: NUDIX domain-containing protein [Chloroflexi bacterium]|nr:NUDIX domain-containing protein [Chloroflexota bacterium]